MCAEVVTIKGTCTAVIKSPALYSLQERKPHCSGFPFNPFSLQLASWSLEFGAQTAPGSHKSETNLESKPDCMQIH